MSALNKRSNSNNSTRFNIIDHLDKLVSDGGSHQKHERTYYCPLCEAKNFKVDLNTGKYGTYGCKCAKTAQGKKAIREALSPSKWIKPDRPKQKRQWHYHDKDSKPVAIVHRIDEGNGKRKFWQTAADGKSKPGKALDRAMPYRYQDCLDAIASGQQVFWTEGEPCADALWNLGIPATTTIGGCKRYCSEQYRELFPSDSLVICPDRDLEGMEYAEKIAADYPQAKWLYAPPSEFQWQNLPPNRGADVADWIEGDKATREMILAAVGDRRNMKGNSTEPVRDRLQAIALEGLPRSEERQLVANLVAHERSFSELWGTYEAIRNETEEGLDLEDSMSNYLQLLEVVELLRVDWRTIFPAALADALLNAADAKRIDPAFIIQPMLAAIGASIGGNIGILGRDGTSEQDAWIEYPVFYTTTVNPPSSGKSTGDRIALEPIQKFQREENRRYDEGLTHLRELEEAWKLKGNPEKEALRTCAENPRVFAQELGQRRRCLIDLATPEALQRRISEQPEAAGVLWATDELSALIASLDEYKSGKESSARSFLLSGWNGKLKGSVDRVDADRSFSFKNQLLCLTGGIQPAKARKVFTSGGDVKQDPEGLTSRFLFAVPKPHPQFAQWSDRRVCIHALLEHLYQEMRSLPATTLRMTPQAEAVWVKTWESLRRKQLEEGDRNPALAAYLGKLCSYALRLTLVLHCVEHVYQAKQDFSRVEASTMQRAQRWMLYYLAQFRELQTHLVESASDGVAEFLKKIRDLCLRKGGKLSPRQVTRTWSRSKLKASYLKECFQQLATVDPTCSFDGKVLSVVSDNCQQSDRQPQNHGGQEMQASSVVSDKTCSMADCSTPSPVEESPPQNESLNTGEDDRQGSTKPESFSQTTVEGVDRPSDKLTDNLPSSECGSTPLEVESCNHVWQLLNHVQDHPDPEINPGCMLSKEFAQLEQALTNSDLNRAIGILERSMRGNAKDLLQILLRDRSDLFERLCQLVVKELANEAG